MGVFPCIFKHFFWYRSLSPIRELVFFVGNDPTVVLEQERKTKPLLLQYSGSLPCIKHVNDIEAEVFLQPLNIIVGSMKNLYLGWIIENRQQGLA